MLHKNLESTIHKIYTIQSTPFKHSDPFTISGGTDDRFNDIIKSIREARFYDACATTYSILHFHLSHDNCIRYELQSKLRPLYKQLYDILDVIDDTYPQLKEEDYMIAEYFDRFNTLLNSKIRISA